jgi:transglutaminase superfamily protein
MSTQRQILDYYKQPGPMTSPGKYSDMLGELPDDIPALTNLVQGLAIHEYVAKSFYGFAVPDERRSESHIRPVGQMLDRLLSLDARPLSLARAPEKRLVGVCHHFMMFLVSMLRARGIPARGRCGFGAYFNPGFFEDHWLCEYWNDAEARWVLVDPQFDDVWQKQLKIDHDVLDVPRDRFLVAADAWLQCRSGAADPSRFGIFKGDLRGLWFIATDLIHDAAALNRVEMLPWDVWGGMPKQNEAIEGDQLGFFDGLAELTRLPDRSVDELRELYHSDDRVCVPGTVFNAILNRAENV